MAVYWGLCLWGSPWYFSQMNSWNPFHSLSKSACVWFQSHSVHDRRVRPHWPRQSPKCDFDSLSNNTKLNERPPLRKLYSGGSNLISIQDLMSLTYLLLGAVILTCARFQTYGPKLHSLVPFTLYQFLFKITTFVPCCLCPNTRACSCYADFLALSFSPSPDLIREYLTNVICGVLKPNIRSRTISSLI